MRKSLVAEILEHLAICGSMMVGSVFFSGRTLGQAIRKIERLAGQCPHDFSSRSSPTLSTTLTRLGKQGFAAHSGPKKKTVWRITRKGKRYLENPKDIELPKSDDKIRLVIFDIPEEQRKKRDWLRVQLRICDFKQLQRSVWVGKRPLLEDLVDKINVMGISECVHIFSVGEKGTLMKVL